MVNKRSKYWECNKVKGQREEKREKKEIAWRERILCQYKVYGKVQVVRNVMKVTIHTSLQCKGVSSTKATRNDTRIVSWYHIRFLWGFSTRN